MTVYAGADPLTGRERRVTRTVKGKPGQKQPPKEARDLEARLLVEVGIGEHREARLTVTELLDRCLEQFGPDLSPKTALEYRRYVDRLITPRIGSVRLDKLTTAMLDGLYRDLRDSGGREGRPLAPGSVRQVHAILRRALVHAERWGWITRNPAALASPPKLKRQEIHPPSAQQVRRILDAARELDAGLGLAVWLAAITGARRGELCGLRWSDLDGESFVIERSVASLSGRIALKDPKTHQARRVTLDEETLRLLKARRVTQSETALACSVHLDDDAYVLSDHAAGWEPLNPDVLSDRFRKLVRRLAIPCRFHDLRHWHVSQALGIGVPVREVADRVGHASARMTLDVYGHSIKHDDRRAAESAATLLANRHDDRRRGRRRAGAVVPRETPTLFEDGNQ